MKNKTKIASKIFVSRHALKSYKEIFFSALEVDYVYPSDEIAEKILHKTKGRHFRSLDKRWILVTDRCLKTIITIFESRSDKRWTTKKRLARKWWAKTQRQRK